MGRQTEHRTDKKQRSLREDIGGMLDLWICLTNSQRETADRSFHLKATEMDHTGGNVGHAQQYRGIWRIRQGFMLSHHSKKDSHSVTTPEVRNSVSTGKNLSVPACQAKILAAKARKR